MKLTDFKMVLSRNHGVVCYPQQSRHSSQRPFSLKTVIRSARSFLLAVSGCKSAVSVPDCIPFLFFPFFLLTKNGHSRSAIATPFLEMKGDAWRD
jgi:hypothetical protein